MKTFSFYRSSAKVAKMSDSGTAIIILIIIIIINHQKELSLFMKCHKAREQNTLVHSAFIHVLRSRFNVSSPWSSHVGS